MYLLDHINHFYNFLEIVGREQSVDLNDIEAIKNIDLPNHTRMIEFITVSAVLDMY